MRVCVCVSCMHITASLRFATNIPFDQFCSASSRSCRSERAVRAHSFLYHSLACQFSDLESLIFLNLKWAASLIWSSHYVQRIATAQISDRHNQCHLASPSDMIDEKESGAPALKRKRQPPPLRLSFHLWTGWILNWAGRTANDNVRIGLR